MVYPASSFLFSSARLARSRLRNLIPRPIKVLTKTSQSMQHQNNSVYASFSVFDPSILSWITSFSVLTIVTQIADITLTAVRIYTASQPLQLSDEVGAEMGYAYVVDEKGVIIINGLGCREYEPSTHRKYLGYSLACCGKQFYLFECCHRAVCYLFVTDE